MKTKQNTPSLVNSNYLGSNTDNSDDFLAITKKEFNTLRDGIVAILITNNR